MLQRMATKVALGERDLNWHTRRHETRLIQYTRMTYHATTSVDSDTETEQSSTFQQPVRGLPVQLRFEGSTRELIISEQPINQLSRAYWDNVLAYTANPSLSSQSVGQRDRGRSRRQASDASVELSVSLDVSRRSSYIVVGRTENLAERTRNSEVFNNTSSRGLRAVEQEDPFSSAFQSSELDDSPENSEFPLIREKEVSLSLSRGGRASQELEDAKLSAGPEEEQYSSPGQMPGNATLDEARETRGMRRRQIYEFSDLEEDSSSSLSFVYERVQKGRSKGAQVTETPVIPSSIEEHHTQSATSPLPLSRSVDQSRSRLASLPRSPLYISQAIASSSPERHPQMSSTNVSRGSIERTSSLNEHSSSRADGELEGMRTQSECRHDQSRMQIDSYYDEIGSPEDGGSQMDLPLSSSPPQFPLSQSPSLPERVINSPRRRLHPQRHDLEDNLDIPRGRIPSSDPSTHLLPPPFSSASRIRSSNLYSSSPVTGVGTTPNRSSSGDTTSFSLPTIEFQEYIHSSPPASALEMADRRPATPGLNHQASTHAQQPSTPSPMTPRHRHALQVYDDSLPAISQPQTPIGLPRHGVPYMASVASGARTAPPLRNRSRRYGTGGEGSPRRMRVMRATGMGRNSEQENLGIAVEQWIIGRARTGSERGFTDEQRDQGEGLDVTPPRVWRRDVD